VKIVWLLKVAAASEGRQTLCQWDLWLLPWCAAPGPDGQAAIEAWLTTRLGVREAYSPPRLTRVVEAFEAQVEVEREADDLDYDESGRLKFSSELEGAVSDSKGGGQAARLSYTRRRRYGQTHIEARLRQIDDLLGQIAACAEELAGHRRELDAYARRSLWLDAAFAESAGANLAATAEILTTLAGRAAAARAGFVALPRLPVDPGTVPEPVVHEPLPA